jgi:hypothetical protein
MSMTLHRLCGYFLTLILTTAIGCCASADAADFFTSPDCEVLSDDDLEQQRGGLRLGGLEISLGIHREIQWNEIVREAAPTHAGLLIQNDLDHQFVRVTNIVDLQLTGVTVQLANLRTNRFYEELSAPSGLW